MTTKLLSTNTKIDKSLKLFPDYEASILQLVPSKTVCDNPFYKNCISNCLSFKGMAKVYPATVVGGRKKRVDLLLSDSPSFMLQLKKEINLQIKRSIKKGKKCCIRLNGFSDIDWSKENYHIEGNVIFDYFKEVQFWDYTKNLDRIRDNQFSNYHLVYSFIESTQTQPSNIKESLEALRLGFNVAIIVKKIESWEIQLLKDKSDHQTIGDDHDFRWKDENQKSGLILLSEKL